MNSQQFAGAVAQLLPRVDVPASPDNVRALASIYQILDSLAQGALILTQQGSCHHSAACSCFESED